MTNYTKSTNFTSKDSLPTGDSLKIVKGAEFDTEFNAIATAIATKADLGSPALTGTPTAPTAAAGTNTTQIATTAFVAAAAALSNIYPIGAIYTSTVSTSPATLFGFGTWVAFGAGRVLLGQDGTTYVAGATGGSANAIIPSHTHTATTTITDNGHAHGITLWPNDSGGASAGVAYGANAQGAQSGATASATTGITAATTVASTGSSATGANLPPYIVVYMWNRTA